MKHSPGPWRIVRNSDITDNPKDKGIACIEASDGTTILFTDSGYFQPKEADAQLVEVAPKMFQALLEIANYDPTKLDAATLGNIARKAIAGIE